MSLLYQKQHLSSTQKDLSVLHNIIDHGYWYDILKKNNKTVKNYSELQKMAYGFAASRLVTFASKYDHPDRWFEGFRVLDEQSQMPLADILSNADTEDRDRDSILMDIELEADLLMLYFQDLLGRMEAGLIELADGANAVAVMASAIDAARKQHPPFPRNTWSLRR
jgi:hypothetical protein